MGNLLSHLYFKDDTTNDSTYKENDKTLISKLTQQVNEKEVQNQRLLSELKCYRQHGSNDQAGGYIDQVYQAKINKDYEYLVLSGGGIKGVCYCGALGVLEELGILYDDETSQLKLKGIAGTSAGSIVAGLLAIGYTPREIKEIMDLMDFNKIVDDKIGFVRDTYNFIEKFGVCPGEYIYEFLGEVIKKKVGDPDYTIEQLYNEKKVKLVIVATDMLHDKTIYFNPLHSDAPNRVVPIRCAIRASMSIPFLFEPVKYNGQLCVDGGVLDNYAIHVFDDEVIGRPDGVLNLLEPNPKVLGLKILTLNQLEKNGASNNVDDIFNYSVNFINLFLTENERRAMTPFNYLRTIEIITDNYPITDFNLSKEQKYKLVAQGESFTRNYFTN